MKISIHSRLHLCNLHFSLSFAAVRFGRVPKREKAKILAAMQSSRMKTQESKVMGELNDDAKIIDCIVRAHYDTCDYTRKKMEPFLQSAKANPKYISCSGTVSLFLSTHSSKASLALNLITQLLCTRRWTLLVSRVLITGLFLLC